MLVSAVVPEKDTEAKAPLLIPANLFLYVLRLWKQLIQT